MTHTGTVWKEKRETGHTEDRVQIQFEVLHLGGSAPVHVTV